MHTNLNFVQVTEKSAELEESSEISVKDGEIMSSHQTSSFSEKTGAKTEVESEQVGDKTITEDNFELPPPPLAEEFPPPPPPLDEDLPPPAELESPTGSRTSYAALVTPTGFVSPTRDEKNASMRSFTHR